MAYLAPADIPRTALGGGHSAELVTLETLRSGLPADYTVYHGVHWSRDWCNVRTFGEADFIVVNRAGRTLVIEQKSGALEESEHGLVKTYGTERKSVAHQIHRTLDGIRDKFRHYHGEAIPLDYLLYCPDYRLQELNAAGLDRSRIIDASEAAALAARIVAILPPAAATSFGNRVHRFFEQSLDLVPDVHAHVTAGERMLTRLSGGLAATLRCFEMAPLRLRVRGTAGCGKSSVAAAFFAAAAEGGRKPLLVCFNRPLAERLKATLGAAGKVDTWYGFLTGFLQSRGVEIDFSQRNRPGFWSDLQDRVIAETVPEDWRFDTVIVDEGQDFEPGWFDILRLFLADGADILWLEDPDQTVRQETSAALDGEGFVGFRARANYRSPESIARFLQRTLPFEFEIANPLPGLGAEVTPYLDPAEQPKLAAAIISKLLRRGFRPADIVVLSLRGLERATLAERVGSYTLRRFAGGYDAHGNQIFTPGQICFDTARRFKGQQAPAVIVTDIDPRPDRLDEEQRLIFSAATRATLRLELLVRRTNPAVAPFLGG